ncbi:MAG: rod shape-determining protein MreC [Chloroflexi bacterium]|nr:rod shape-determining protein MreC [Chloroflexota bacterium]
MLLVTAMTMLLLARMPVASDLEDRIAATVAPAVRIVHDLVRPVTDVALHAGQIAELAAENATLRQQLSRAEADLATLREGRIAIDQANALIASIGNDSGQVVTATVVLRDPAPGRQSVVLNRGRDDGVRTGQPVLGAGATLLGVVAEVTDSRARVRLITDRESAHAVLIQASRLPGSLVGDGERLLLDFVPVDASVTPGDVILTSALGGLLPPGLLVGRVREVDAPAQELFQRIVVDPLANLDRVEQVLVMTGFRPGTSIEETEQEPVR